MGEYYLDGDTVRLVSTFYDWEDKVVFPDEVILTIFDYSWKQLDQFTLSSANRNTDGEYFYDYIFNGVGKFYYEWKGLIGGSSPNLERNDVKIKRI
ncbi:hypothetical protein [Halobacillus sp. H74]|uniref:hypothetical protein n=1 Tax=Halobacillus sp. H74 TaxID=3457436 RepID=UPI003FCD9854